MSHVNFELAENDKCKYHMSTCVARWVRRLDTDPVIMRSSPTTDIYILHCWLINPNKFNLLSRLLACLYNK